MSMYYVQKMRFKTNPSVIATGCPYCNTMMTDGIKFKEKEDDVAVLDVAELVANAQDLEL